MNKNPIFYALDFSSIEKSKEMLTLIKDHIGGVKIGLQFFIANGMDGVREIAKFALPIFLDLKLYDIPNTVGKSIKEISKIDAIAMTTVHISGGTEMLSAALDGRCNKKLKILGVTILTSANNNFVSNMDVNKNQLVEHMAHVAQHVGLHGIICSGLENNAVRTVCGADFIIVNPGIRMKNDAQEDQKRVVTPSSAMQNGANFLVIGRSISNSKNPVKAVQEILESLNKNKSMLM